MIVIVMAPVINRIGDASFCRRCPLIGQMTPVWSSDWLTMSGAGVTMMGQTGRFVTAAV